MAASRDSSTDHQRDGTDSSRAAAGRADDKRPQFGTRYLTNPANVFEHNAWDNVEWDAEQEETAKKKVHENSANPVTEEKRDEYERSADRYWDTFYGVHQNRFFKDRHWLFTEFPELSQQRRGQPDQCNVQRAEEPPGSFPGSRSSYRILEVGCGAGNTVFPILQANDDPSLFVYCCDFSKVAVDIVQNHTSFETKRCHPFVCDIADPSSQFPFPPHSLDLIVLIFVLSAIQPEKMQECINRLSGYLKPGGTILFRDYGRYDMAQLRFKNGQCISDNFYVRGDGTRVYFFTQDELRTMFMTAGLEEAQNLIDRRLQINRGRQLKMYRVWIQCKYRKPINNS